jgi:hypothetical protein
MVDCGKRLESRLRVRLPAKLITHLGEYAVVLKDLSCWGASISRLDLPHQLGDGVLLWHRFEGFGKIRWCNQHSCGMRFYEPIEPAWLIETRNLDDVEHLPEDKELHRRSAREWVAGISRI